MDFHAVHLQEIEQTGLQATAIVIGGQHVRRGTLGGRRVPTRMQMTVASKPGEHTAITYETLKFDITIPESKFTEQALRH